MAPDNHVARIPFLKDLPDQIDPEYDDEDDENKRDENLIVAGDWNFVEDTRLDKIGNPSPNRVSWPLANAQFDS